MAIVEKSAEAIAEVRAVLVVQQRIQLRVSSENKLCSHFRHAPSKPAAALPLKAHFISAQTIPMSCFPLFDAFPVVLSWLS